MTTKYQQPLVSNNGAVVYLPPCPLAGQFNLGTPDIYAESQTPLFPIGTLAWFPGLGKKYRYSKAGAALTGTKILVANANYVPDGSGHANIDGFFGSLHSDIAIGAAVLAFHDTVNKAKDFFAGGYLLHFDAARNVCYEDSYIISGPPAPTTTLTDSWYTEVTLAEPKKYAGIAADGIQIWCNPYSQIEMATSSGYETYMGVPPIPVQSGYYFWLQTAGPVFITPNGWSTLCPGFAANSRVCMSISGILTTQAAQGTGHQVIGTLLATTLSGSADAWLNLNLDLGH